MYDAVIIGSGPAGLSAALNLKIRGKSFIWFGSRNMSEKLSKAEKINNYPGLPDISGAELFEQFKMHAQKMELSITEKMVTNILYNDGHYMLLAENEMYEAQTLILAMGVMTQKPLKGEQKLLGNGVSYCATCDGMLYRGKTIGVISTSEKYEEEVSFLAGLAEKVYFFPAYPVSAPLAENVTVQKEVPTEITGDGRVDGIVLRGGEKLPLDGVFCLRDSILPTALLSGLAMEDGHILVNRRMETNLPGCYAAGDCTGRPYQYAKAVGEGNVAAHSVIEYLAARQRELR